MLSGLREHHFHVEVLASVRYVARAEGRADFVGGAVGRGARMKSPIKRRHRDEVFVRDGWTCQYCGDPSLCPASATADHIIPAVCGGSHLPENLRTACRSCNCAKRHAPLEDFRLLRTLEQAGLAHILSTTQAKALMQAGIDLKLPPAHVFFFERAES